MIFDEIDESGGYISGEIPLIDVQAYILERTGQYQHIDLHSLVYIQEEDGEDEDGDGPESQTLGSGASSSSTSTSSASFYHQKSASATSDNNSQNTINLKAQNNENDNKVGIELTKEMKAAIAEEKWNLDDNKGGGFKWEEEADDLTMIPCLSIRVSDRDFGCLRSRIVPGIVVIGRPGLWWTYPLEEERTSAVGVFFRDIHAVMTHVPTVFHYYYYYFVLYFPSTLIQVYPFL